MSLSSISSSLAAARPASTAALTAARHGLSVVVIEKTSRFGGSTARSGGGIWVPRNSVLNRAGVRDSHGAGRGYLAHVAGDQSRPPGSERCSSTAPRCSTWSGRPAQSTSPGFPATPTTIPRRPAGWRAAGRSSRCRSTAGCSAPTWTAEPAYLPAPAGVSITAADYRWLSLGTRHPRAIWTTAKVAARTARTKLLHQRTLSLGQALAAGLRGGLASAGIPLWLDTPLTGLVIDGDTVTGVRATRHGEPITITARRGVLIATGGFERNAAMRAQYQRQPIGTDWTVGSPGNTGDGITLGQTAGAALDLMDDAWWGPSIPLTGGPYFCLAERSLPGCILVNAAGQRFVNEAAPYVDAVHAMYDGHTDDKPHIPAWLITDQRYRNNYVFARLPPRKNLPRRWYSAGTVFRATR